MANLDIDKIDFDRCENEPIHIPESIQEYGFFFALDPKTFKTLVYSANFDKLFNSSSKVLERNFFELLDLPDDDKDFILDSYERAKTRDTRLPVEIIFKENYLEDKEQTVYHAVVYHTQEYFVFEIEPDVKFIKSNSAKQYSKLYSANISPKYKELENIRELAQSITDTVKKLTGYERVVIYKFNSDNSGKVIAESIEEGMDSYLDLYYPAGDIPKQARELYTKNWIRLTPDVDLNPVPLLPKISEKKRERIDLTKSLLRSMSPIHLQYVRNQGLKSSMSISLVTHGDLWGLISCHSRKKHYIPQNIRIDCEELSQLFSWQLYAKEEELRLKRKTTIENFVDSILAELSERRSIVEVFHANQDEILEMMQASGFIFNFNGKETIIGEVPDNKLLSKLQHRGKTDEISVWRSSFLESDLELPHGSIDQKGALYIPLTKDDNCFTAWFRDEKVQIQRWAGTPEEKNFSADKKERLTPRKSFKVHEVKVFNHSEDWTKTDIEIAEKFHKLFLSYSLSQQEAMQANISFLEEKDQTKDEFLATLAHELRNPLSPMENAIALLEEIDDLSSDEVKNTLHVLKRQQNQLGTLVDDLLDVSQITRRRMRMNIRDVNLHDLLVSSSETARSLISAKDQTLTLDFDCHETLLRGDFSRLMQAFGNIVNNASKYSYEGGKITLRVEKKVSEVTVLISDDGIGIAKENQKNIFDMFSQVDASENTRGGLGIGLTLSKKIIEMHDGKIRLSSEGKDKGTTFKITLPIAKEHHNEVEKENSSVEEGLSGKTLLLVDDNQDILDTTEFLLKRKGMVIETASNGKNALKKFEQNNYDFVILDIGLPDISGYDLCLEMQKIVKEKNLQLPYFIAQSGWGQAKDINRAKDTGFDQHATKPVKVKKLYEIMLNLIK